MKKYQILNLVLILDFLINHNNNLKKNCKNPRKSQKKILIKILHLLQWIIFNQKTKNSLYNNLALKAFQVKIQNQIY